MSELTNRPAVDSPLAQAEVQRLLPRVPYIATWSGEPPVRTQVVRTNWPARIAYADEVPHDRDGRGVLWRRALLQPGRGKPQFGLVHPLRQRHAMRRLLCQVCGSSADRTEQGVLWLLGDDRGDWADWPEEMAATHPPVCLPCAHAAVRLCPYLRRKFVAVRVRRPEVSGVHGRLYEAFGAATKASGDVIVRFSDPAINWVQAFELVMCLRECTFVDLEAELTQLRSDG